jgi:hypothetical protein
VWVYLPAPDPTVETPITDPYSRPLR